MLRFFVQYVEYRLKVVTQQHKSQMSETYRRQFVTVDKADTASKLIPPEWVSSSLHLLKHVWYDTWKHWTIQKGMIFSLHLQSYDIFFFAFPHFSVLKNDKLKAIHSDTNTKGDPTSICTNHRFSLTRVSQWIGWRQTILSKQSTLLVQIASFTPTEHHRGKDTNLHVLFISYLALFNY